MNGLPAAATLGDSLNIERELARIAVSPRQDSILASAADTGAVLLIVPGNPPVNLSASPHPDEIVMSLKGFSAALWYSSPAHFEVVSGLPAAPSTRQVDASSLASSPGAIAVSDDGQWIAAASSNGVYAWGPNALPRQLYSGSDAGALAFFTQRSDLALATATQLLSITDIVGVASTSVIDQGAFSPAGVGVSFDNQKLVLADLSGTVYSIDLGTGVASTFDCQCRPAGVFGLGGAVFRLTGSTREAIELFDADASAVLAIPPVGVRTPSIVHPAQTSAPLPTFTIGLPSTAPGYDQQPGMTITASSTYPSEIDGTVTLAFVSSVGGDDEAIQFTTGGRTVNFVIAAGSTQATFSGKSSATFLTGTVAGTITLTAGVTAPTPAPSVASRTYNTTPAPPFLTGVTFSQTSTGLSVVATGFSSSRDMVSGLFHFAPSSNATISQQDVTVQLQQAFASWYENPAANATGSQFVLTVPFSVQGSAADVVAVTVTLTNSVGPSTPVSPH